MGEYLVSKKHPETHLRALFQLESGGKQIDIKEKIAA